MVDPVVSRRPQALGIDGVVGEGFDLILRPSVPFADVQVIMRADTPDGPDDPDLAPVCTPAGGMAWGISWSDAQNAVMTRDRMWWWVLRALIGGKWKTVLSERYVMNPDGTPGASTSLDQTMTINLGDQIIQLDVAIAVGQTPAEILAALTTVDGPSSGLNADLVDGKHASEFEIAGAATAALAAAAALVDDLSGVTNQAGARTNLGLGTIATQPASAFVPFVGAASYAWNPDGTVASVTEGGLVTTYTYNPDGTVATATRNAVVFTYTYNPDGTLANIA